MNEPEHTPWLTIIGIGDDGLEGLSPRAAQKLSQCEIIVGGARHIEMVPPDDRQRIAWPTPLTDAIDDIAKLAPKKVAVLASGDPMCFGIGNTLARHFSASELEVYPSPSAFSLAAARLLWPLGEISCLSLHGRPEALLEKHISPGNRILLLSSDGTTPGKVAGRLKARGFGPSKMTILEHMRGPSERARSMSAEAFGMNDIADLNVIAVECLAGPDAQIYSATPGLEDELFSTDGQITRSEVRAITLARLMPQPGHCLWDIGAGSGSVSIEWLRAAPGATAYAVEPRTDRCENIKLNVQNFGVPRLKLIEGSAPEALTDLPTPDAIFIGGGLTSASASLIDDVLGRLAPGGRVVANVVTLQSEAVLIAAQQKHGGSLTRIAISNVGPLAQHSAWEAQRPVIQWSYQAPWAN